MRSMQFDDTVEDKDAAFSKKTHKEADSERIDICLCVDKEESEYGGTYEET